MPRRLHLITNAVDEVFNAHDVLVSIDKKIAELNQEAVFHQNHLDAIASKLRNLQRAHKYIIDNYKP
jgi:hypothetical protein